MTCEHVGLNPPSLAREAVRQALYGDLLCTVASLPESKIRVARHQMMMRPSRMTIHQRLMPGWPAGEEVVTKESFVSIAWRLVPYWVRPWRLSFQVSVLRARLSCFRPPF